MTTTKRVGVVEQAVVVVLEYEFRARGKYSMESKGLTDSRDQHHQHHHHHSKGTTRGTAHVPRTVITVDGGLGSNHHHGAPSSAEGGSAAKSSNNNNDGGAGGGRGKAGGRGLVGPTIGTDPSSVGDAASQEKTPKHANRTKEDESSKVLQQSEADKSKDGEKLRKQKQQQQQQQQQQQTGRMPSMNHPGWHSHPGQPHYHASHGSFAFDAAHRMGGAGAFQPRDRHGGFPPPHHGHPIHVSPGSTSGGGGGAGGGAGGGGGGARYYGHYGAGGPTRYAGAGPPPPQAAYEQRYAADYQQQRYDHHHHHQPTGYPQRHYAHASHHPPPLYPPAQHPYSPSAAAAAGYPEGSGGVRASWGMPPNFAPPLPPSHSGGGGAAGGRQVLATSSSLNPDYYPPSRGGGAGGGSGGTGGAAAGNSGGGGGGGNVGQHVSTNSSTFSRAVSGSFDRSSKSSQGKVAGANNMGNNRTTSSAQNRPSAASTTATGGGGGGGGDNGSIDDDASWKMLNQVHSVDEDEMRRRKMQKREDTPESRKEVAVAPPGSNSSSLTNSPTEEVEQKKAPVREVRDQSKRTSSLDSLSSVASAQEPMETSHKQSSKPSSPGGSSGSLDLMKCASGSSAHLLLPSHHRNMSQCSFTGPDVAAASAKRPHDEQREDVVDTGGKGEKEIRKAPSEDGRPTKKSRVETHKEPKKSSPLSITCSPPNSPAAEKRKSDSKMHQPQAVYPRRKEQSPGYYDKPPSYSYSMDSAPALPSRDSGQRPDSYPPLAPRPGSSSSSTITPINSEHNEMRHHPGVSQLPSWEIHGQDSFGASSANGGLITSFSFQQDYPMLGASASGELQPPPPSGGGGGGPPLHPGSSQERGATQALPETRNQSFDGGHYHGSFGGGSESMMSYENRGAPYDGRQPYQGPFPPHAPSWGSASSYPTAPPHGYGQYRGGYPAMMRNYSEDSGARTSPPPGSSASGMRMLPPNFQPPPEFRAPPSMVSKSGPQNTILTSPYNPSPKVGPYGWSKEEDSQLTEIMKKYKNPRDWEPIAKEHNHGRTAKECHERWIRYLKPGVRKGQWTDHEDAIVMEVVTTSSEQPFTRWSDLAQRLPGRVGKQIRDRWVNHLNPAINHLPFSREDDLLLWEGHKKLGKRWVEISTKYFHSSRSENHIKNRWYSASFKKFIANEFGPDAYSGGKSSSSSSSKKDPSSPDKKKKSSSSSSGVGGMGHGSNRRRGPGGGGGHDNAHVEAV